MSYFVYILASKKNGTLYVGVTNNIERRVHEHKLGLTEGFTKKYKVHTLVYCEEYSEVQTAIAREKQIKKWSRTTKLTAIEQENPHWDDLANFSGSPLRRG